MFQIRFKQERRTLSNPSAPTASMALLSLIPYIPPFLSGSIRNGLCYFQGFKACCTHQPHFHLQRPPCPHNPCFSIFFAIVVSIWVHDAKLFHVSSCTFGPLNALSPCTPDSLALPPPLTVFFQFQLHGAFTPLRMFIGYLFPQRVPKHVHRDLLPFPLQAFFYVSCTPCPLIRILTSTLFSLVFRSNLELGRPMAPAPQISPFHPRHRHDHIFSQRFSRCLWQCPSLPVSHFPPLFNPLMHVSSHLHPPGRGIP